MEPQASFSSLPVELVSMIAVFVHPEDIVSLACTCKGIKSICEARLAEHQDLSRRFGRVIIGDQLWRSTRPGQYSEVTSFDHAIRLLQEIDQNPFVAHYIRYLSYCQEDYDLEIYQDEESREWHDDLPDILLQTSFFQALIDRVPILQKDQDLKIACTESMATGHAHMCLMLILALSENLIHLRTCDEIDPGAWARSARDNECQFLCSLQEVSLSMHDYDWHLEPSMLHNWTGIPSVQNLVCRRINDHDGSGLLLPAPAPRALSSLKLVGGLHEDDVGAIVSMFKDLRHFTFLFDVHVDDGFFACDASIIIQALEHVSLTTLDSIVLRFYGCPEGQPLKMSRFESLTSFDGLLSMLDLKVSRNATHLMLDLANVFPPSLLALTLRTWECWHDAWQTLRCPLYPWTRPVPLVLRGLVQFPKLKDIKLSSGRLDSLTAHILLERGATVKVGKLPDPYYGST